MYNIIATLLVLCQIIRVTLDATVSKTNVEISIIQPKEQLESDYITYIITIVMKVQYSVGITGYREIKPPVSPLASAKTGVTRGSRARQTDS